MRALDLKLLRDLNAMKGQMIAVAVVMACGLMVMMMERGLVVSLERSKEAYYREHRLADVFCDLKRAPNAVRSRLEALPDIAAVETRVTGGAILDIPGMDDIAEGLIISIPDERPQQLHLLHLRSGRLPLEGNRREVVVSEAFAEAHGYRPGDTIDATIHGAREQLDIVGVALSPEFVYELPAGAVIPDNWRFGIFWMNESALATAMGLEGAFNNVIVDVAPGGDISAVKDRVDRVLRPYGGQVAYDRTDHTSVKMVEDEIRGLRVAAIAFPAVFLSVATFMTSAALTRLVRLQREQVAQLKAVGYASWDIARHYFQYALVTVTAATVTGIAAGLLMGRFLIRLYHPFFRFPTLEFQPDWVAFMFALLLSVGLSLLGVLNAVRQALQLPPAEAMRPEPPAQFKPSFLEQAGFQELASTSFRMALRNLERKPWHALFTAVGISLATALPILSVSMGTGMDYMMEFQWSRVLRQDVTLALIEPTSYSALPEIRNLPGVIHAEPFRSVPARLRYGHRDHRVGITGMPQNTELQQLLDVEGRRVTLPVSGLLLSEHLADLLHVAPGDTLQVEVQEGRRPVLNMQVTGTITDYAGVGAYMEIGQLRRAMQEGETISGANVSVDQAQWGDFVSRVKESPRIASIITTRAAQESYDKIMGDMMGVTEAIFSAFAVILTFGVIYNGVRIALSERTRDLATLRVLGFTRREVAAILVTELALLTLLALGPGLYIGKELTRLILESVSTETMRIPVIVTARAYATAVALVLAASALSFAVVSRRIVHLDLLGVLKARE